MHDPKELREMARSYTTGPVVKAALRSYADLIERHANLLEHSRAMALELSLLIDFARKYSNSQFIAANSVLNAYRADFPREE